MQQKYKPADQLVCACSDCGAYFIRQLRIKESKPYVYCDACCGKPVHVKELDELMALPSIDFGKKKPSLKEIKVEELHD